MSDEVDKVRKALEDDGQLDILTCDICEGPTFEDELHITKDQAVICAECAQRAGIELEDDTPPVQ